MAEDRLTTNLVNLLTRVGTKYIMSLDPSEKVDLAMVSSIINSALIVASTDITKATRLYVLASRLYRERGGEEDIQETSIKKKVLP